MKSKICHLVKYRGQLTMGGFGLSHSQKACHYKEKRGYLSPSLMLSHKPMLWLLPSIAISFVYANNIISLTLTIHNRFFKRKEYNHNILSRKQCFKLKRQVLFINIIFKFVV